MKACKKTCSKRMKGGMNSSKNLEGMSLKGGMNSPTNMEGLESKVGGRRTRRRRRSHRKH